VPPDDAILQTGQQEEKQPMQKQESRAMNFMFIARLIIYTYFK